MKVYMSFRLLPPTSTYYTLPYLPQVKVKRGKSERMQAPYKEQKASNAVHLPPLLESVEFLLYNY